MVAYKPAYYEKKLEVNPSVLPELKLLTIILDEVTQMEIDEDDFYEEKQRIILINKLVKTISELKKQKEPFTLEDLKHILDGIQIIIKYHVRDEKILNGLSSDLNHFLDTGSLSFLTSSKKAEKVEKLSDPMKGAKIMSFDEDD